MKKFILILAIFLFNFSFALEEGLSINTLPSGQKVIIKEIKDNPIVKIDTWINTGSINENDKTSGISHFLEHLFFKGTQNYPTGAIDRILDSKGAEVNAATSKDYTHYYIQIPSEHFDLALKLHTDMSPTEYINSIKADNVLWFYTQKTAKNLAVFYIEY